MLHAIATHFLAVSAGTIIGVFVFALLQMARDD